MSRATASNFANLAKAIGVTVASLAVFLPVSANAAQPLKFHVKLEPEKLGKSTTVTVGFTIPTVPGVLPPALTSFSVRLPAGMGLAPATLGVDTCANETLAHGGPASCPPDSAMGFGTAMAEAPFGSEIIEEPGRVSTFMTQSRDENTTLLYYFDGKVPVIAPQIFLSEFLSPGNSPISELATSLPLIPALPGTPDASMISMQVSLGPNHLTYYKHVGKKVVSYKPVGMEVPPKCPKTGFKFAANFAFADGTHVSTTKYVKCP